MEVNEMDGNFSHDSLESYLIDKPEPTLVCPHCGATVKRYIHHGAGGWVPVWKCQKHGDVIAVESKRIKS